jgi:hypothetical protein
MISFTKMAVILSERGPERFLQFGGGESKGSAVALKLLCKNSLNLLDAALRAV